MREVALYGHARTTYDLMSPTEQASLDRSLHRLEEDPGPDGEITFAVPGVPGFFIYDDALWRLSYAVPDDATVVIRSITHALDLPS